PCKRSFPCGNAPDDRPPLESRKGTRSQVPDAHRLEGHLAVPAIVDTPRLIERLATQHHLRFKRHGLSVWTSPTRPRSERMVSSLDRCRSAAQFHGEDYISHRPPSVFLMHVVVPLCLASIKGNHMMDAQTTVP